MFKKLTHSAMIFFAGIILTAILFTLWRSPAPTKYIYFSEPVTISGHAAGQGQLVKSDYKPTPTLAPGATPRSVDQDFTKQIDIAGQITAADKQGRKSTITYTGQATIDKTGDNLTADIRFDPDGKLDYSYLVVTPKLNEAGLFYSSLNGPGAYYRRYFNKVLLFYPSVEIRAPFNALGRSEIDLNLQVRF